MLEEHIILQAEVLEHMEQERDMDLVLIQVEEVLEETIMDLLE